jgi:trehalose 6-phosphate phosphatase
MTMRASEDDAALRAFSTRDGRAGVLLDFDGTLSPIVARPELAKIRDGARDAIARLVERLAIVAVISGRTPAELEELVAVPGVVLAGLYGLGEDAITLPAGVADQVAGIAATVPGTRVESKGASIAVHFRGADDPDDARGRLAPALEAVALDSGMALIAGKKVWELVPGGRPLKEGAVERIVTEARLDAVLYAGDDVADQRAFEALDRLAAAGLTTLKVAVHGPETPPLLAGSADIVVDGPAGLVSLLRRI